MALLPPEDEFSMPDNAADTVISLSHEKGSVLWDETSNPSQSFAHEMEY